MENSSAMMDVAKAETDVREVTSPRLPSPENVGSPKTIGPATSTAPIVRTTEVTSPEPRQDTPKPTKPPKNHHHQQPPPQPFVRQNTVGSVMLAGVNIVSLVIDGKERLCLAQISNTLLKAYSYNEIHNRRVALGITCVQCTPVQLEILRRAGAMPVSSRRCGMITKREAERLVKSFLEDTCPPRLPDNFSFDVSHECGWGGRGSFIPSRYNSSRAKCIKCSFCNMFFSPNKFIFHYHRTPESKYNHPDAANFNSWRRHLKLSDEHPGEDLLHAWEDVKAMFNGGSRKRVLNSHIQSHHHSRSHSPSSSTPQHSLSHPSRSPSSISQPSPDYCKRPKMDSERLPSPGCQMPPVTSQNQQQAGFQYPVFPVPNKVVPMKSVPAHPAFTVPFSYDKPLPEGQAVMKATHPGPWPSSIPDTYYPPYEMIWAKHLGLTAPETSFAHRTLTIGTHGDPGAVSPRGHHPVLSPSSSRDGRQSVDTSCGEEPMRCGDMNDVSYQMTFVTGDENDRKRHLSAFKPVAHKYSHHEFDSCSERLREEMSEASTEADFREESEAGSDNEEVDVDTVEEGVDFKIRMYKTDEQLEENNNDPTTTCDDAKQEPTHNTSDRMEQGRNESKSDALNQTAPLVLKAPASPASMTGSVTSTASHAHDLPDDQGKSDRNQARPTITQRLIPSPTAGVTAVFKPTSPTVEGHEERESALLKDLASLTKDDLREELVQEIRVRKKIEDDCRMIKETFQEQVKRELAYREEMAKQLQVVRETLCHELDQERKVRFSLQQKLKEAHDALHNFSCKMLASRQCSECSFKEPMMPR